MPGPPLSLRCPSAYRQDAHGPPPNLEVGGLHSHGCTHRRATPLGLHGPAVTGWVAGLLDVSAQQRTPPAAPGCGRLVMRHALASALCRHNAMPALCKHTTHSAAGTSNAASEGEVVRVVMTRRRDAHSSVKTLPTPTEDGERRGDAVGFVNPPHPARTNLVLMLSKLLRPCPLWHVWLGRIGIAGQPSVRQACAPALTTV